jgi:SagB-type dehydrogenase family enzyme
MDLKTMSNDLDFLKADLWQQWETLETDQKARIAAPPVEKPAPPDSRRITLIAPESFTVGELSVRAAIQQRRSRREYTEQPLSLEELSYLLWATQGVREVFRGKATFRSVPSAGARHPFETYILAQNISGMEQGLYRYLAVEHQLIWLKPFDKVAEPINLGCSNFAGGSAVIFIWTAIPYRTAWRYGVLSPKLIALDAGHVCQNLYMACESIHAGTCAVGAYDQQLVDIALGVDGESEFTVYMAPVGKVK